MMTSVEDQIKIALLADRLKLSPEECLSALDIPHDRYNNGGLAEVIMIAAEDDTCDWIEDRIRLEAQKAKELRHLESVMNGDDINDA